MQPPPPEPTAKDAATEAESAAAESRREPAVAPVVKPAIIWKCARDGLAPQLLSSLTAVAEAYYSRTSERITVNSGRRTLRHQARLMADFSIPQLEGMYCRNGYPSYIRDIASARKSAGRKLTVDETYGILRNRSEGYISTHLFGAAVDLAPPRKNVALLKQLLKEQGFRVLDERSLGVECIHATYRDTPRHIVRE